MFNIDLSIKIKTLCRYTIDECIGNKVVSVAALIMTTMVVIGTLMRRWLLTSPNKIILDFSCGGYQIFIVIFCMMYVVPYVDRQKTYQTLYHFLACGISRQDFIYGVYYGFVSLSIACGCFVYSLTNGIYWWETGTTCFLSILSIGTITISAIVYITSAFFFSVLIDNSAIAALSFLIFYCTSYLINSWWHFVQQELQGIVYVLGSLCYFLIPDAQLLNIKQAVVYCLPINYILLIAQALYALSWSFVLLHVTKHLFVYKKHI